MSRKRIFALLAALAALVALLAPAGAGGGGSSEDSPQKVIEQATFEGVESGEHRRRPERQSRRRARRQRESRPLRPVPVDRQRSLPRTGDDAIKANGEADGENVDFEGGLTVLNDRAYVGFDGNNYEVDPTTFGFIKSGFEEAEQEGDKESKGAEATACQKAATSLDLGEFVDNLENEGGEEVDGVEDDEAERRPQPAEGGRRDDQAGRNARPAPRSSKPPARCRSAS